PDFRSFVLRRIPQEKSCDTIRSDSMRAGMKPESRNDMKVTKTQITRDLKRMARPNGHFDAQRYFRGDHRLRFYNIGTQPIRAFALSIYKAYRQQWSVEDAMRLANELIPDPYLEAKLVGIELVARFHRAFAPGLLPSWKNWLAAN